MFFYFIIYWILIRVGNSIIKHHLSPFHGYTGDGEPFANISVQLVESIKIDNKAVKS